ncbi:hypothetical protein ACPVPU_11645 [Sphingomonas sp. CJ99]
MRRLALLAATAMLVVGSPALAQGKGNGQGNGGGQGPAKAGGPAKGNGGPGKGNGAKPDRGGPPRVAERGPSGIDRRGGPDRNDRGNGRDNRPGKDVVRIDRGPPGQGRLDRGPVFVERGPDRRDVRDVRVVRNPVERVRYADNGRWYDGRTVVIDGCPPGLAKKNNGCLPPGQAKKLWGNSQRYDNWYGNWGSWRDDRRYDYRYSDGYLYRVNPQTSLVVGFLPLLGGALFGGNAWPQSYVDYDVPQYYDSYYGYDDGLDYRYADGAILGVNPSSGAIDGIAALLTGNEWAVGQPMPPGYDFYNVPPQYRDRYVDGTDAMYRYSDGYVYEIDPTTLLIQQAIELLL